MLKRVAVGLLGVIMLSVLGHVVFVPSDVHAQTVEEAHRTLATTEQRLAAQVRKSATQASSVTEKLTRGEQGLSEQVAEFGRSHERLQQLQDELGKDIAAFAEARAAKLAAFDQELTAIKDATTRRQMERLRTRAVHELNERLVTARATLDTLQLVLAQGEDLVHAAKCVQLADDLTVGSQDLASQVQRAKDQASAYATLTTTLLASLTKTDSER